MKALLWFLFAGIIGFSITIGCERDNSIKKEEKKLILSGKLDSSSGCKNQKLKLSITDSTDSIGCIIYNYETEINKLKMKHLDVWLNCCPDSIHVIITNSNDTILIHESDGGGYCGCLCPYDLYFEINGVEAKKYRFLIDQPYSWGQTYNFELDFSLTTKGIYCK